jgi:SNF2 family DNA or RNA helicase
MIRRLKKDVNLSLSNKKRLVHQVKLNPEDKKIVSALLQQREKLQEKYASEVNCEMQCHVVIYFDISFLIRKMKAKRWIYLMKFVC